MTDASPTPPNRQDPHLDPADDSDEPAFDWMKPHSAIPADPTPADPTPESATADTPMPEESATVSPVPVPEESASARNQQGRRADRNAQEDAVGPSRKGNDAVFSEPLPTSALQIRPPQEDVERRNAERELAARAKPITPRVMQVLLAVFYPLILLVLAVRAVTSPLFLWVEYNRPGFPGDGYGFNTDDRMTYGSYAVDYLSNWSGPRYLGELVSRSGEPLFRDGEVSHMADVKLVILSTFGAGALLILLSLIAVIYLRRRGPGGVRRGLFAGSIIALVIIIGLGALAALGWEQFFTEFHRIFFANGTWTFSLQDTLIRLFPGQFWVDAGIVIGALVLLTSLLTLILTWPTRKRRGLAKEARETGPAKGIVRGSRGKGSKSRDMIAGGGAGPEDAPDPAHEGHHHEPV
ncbi:TIGR01906 family membrane protein [Arthrobacter sp. PAMC25564]|uniref:TIGR01906 family membrane protein n=1 Tax=Arthrobacter sp. PAMC25564 TaxID=2565366 RepID=UPI0010A26F48|nr:TIGR01906 family membrane protein [Arthrobacter sp. PAMC25564]QCB98443.1 TIGR01906 family membrane protein [Arthrobacter sp. PAMC25564]